jgi:hypothetical protein
MQFKFSSPVQAKEFATPLKKGQVLKVEVQVKMTDNVYMLAYKKFRFTAWSDVDLMDKACWLKVEAILPHPVFRVVIEDKSQQIEKLVDYALKNNHLLCKLNKNFKQILSKLSLSEEPIDLFYFYVLYDSLISISSLFPDMKPFFFKNRYVPLRNIMDFYRIDCRYYHKYNKLDKSSFALIFKTEDLEKLNFWKEDMDDFDVLPFLHDIENYNIHAQIAQKVSNIEDINQCLSVPAFKLGVLYIEYEYYRVFIPVETYFEDNYLKISGSLVYNPLSGLPLNTNIFFKSVISNDISKITFCLENNTYLKAIESKCKKMLFDNKLEFNNIIPQMEFELYKFSFEYSENRWDLKI